MPPDAQPTQEPSARATVPASVAPPEAVTGDARPPAAPPGGEAGPGATPPPALDAARPSPRPRGAGTARGLAGPVVPAEPALQQRAVAALFLAMLSLVGLAGMSDLGRGIYVVLYALLAGTLALWLSLTAINRAQRARTARPRGSAVAAVIAALGVAVSVLMLAVFMVLGKQLTSYSRCLNGVNTIAAEQACQTHLTRAVSREIAVLRAVGG
jgi:hypothetical protein